MVATDAVMQAHLEHVVNSLVNETRGAVDRDEIRRVVDESYEEVAADAKIESFIPILTMRNARVLLRARMAASGRAEKEHKAVLIVCGTNAGRSQVSAALLRFYAPGRLDVVSAGQDPAEDVVEAATVYMREHGVELTDFPKRMRPEYMEAADHVVVMGSTEVDLPPGKDVERWDVPHMSGLSHDELREAIHTIDDRVRAFLVRVLPDFELPPSIFEVRP